MVATGGLLPAPLVENAHNESPATGFPATSFTPARPPRTSTLYAVPGTRLDTGSRVAVRVRPS